MDNNHRISVEVCNPKFNDELNIYYINILDKSKKDLDFVNNNGIDSIDKLGMGLKHTAIKTVPKVEVVDIDNSLMIDEYIDVSNRSKILEYAHKFYSKDLDVNKYISLIDIENSAVRIIMKPLIENNLPVTIIDNGTGIAKTIPYSVFALLSIVFNHCMNNNRIKAFELRCMKDKQSVEVIIIFNNKPKRYKSYRKGYRLIPFINIYIRKVGLFGR